MAMALIGVEKASLFYKAAATLCVGADLDYKPQQDCRGREIHRIPPAVGESWRAFQVLMPVAQRPLHS